MMIRRAKVLEVLSNRCHQVLFCEVIGVPDVVDEDLASRFAPGSRYKAVCYPELLGEAQVGDILQIEVSALAKSLGTGGAATVVANESRLPDDQLPRPGHLVKARYTPTQKMVLGADEPDSPWYPELKDASDLKKIPVIVADLHSALPAIVAGYRHRDPQARLVYIMTDGAALPLAYSNVVAQLRHSGELAATITCGQAFGGDFEAVNLASALFIAQRVVRASAVIVTQGPGNLGTGTRWGFSGLDVAWHLQCVQALGGKGVAVLRLSNGEARRRHFGFSHHCLTALTAFGIPAIDVPVPIFNPDCPAQASLADPEGDFATALAPDLETLKQYHRLHFVPTENLYRVLEAYPVKFSTMGRGLDADPAAFLAAAVAGTFSADLAGENPTPQT